MLILLLGGGLLLFAMNKMLDDSKGSSGSSSPSGSGGTSLPPGASLPAPQAVCDAAMATIEDPALRKAVGAALLYGNDATQLTNLATILENNGYPEAAACIRARVAKIGGSASGGLPPLPSTSDLPASWTPSSDVFAAPAKEPEYTMTINAANEAAHSGESGGPKGLPVSYEDARDIVYKG